MSVTMPGPEVHGEKGRSTRRPRTQCMPPLGQPVLSSHTFAASHAYGHAKVPGAPPCSVSSLLRGEDRCGVDVELTDAG